MRGLLLVPVLMLAACGSEDAGLVGSWRNATSGYPVTYHASGAYQEGEGGEGNTGQWSVEGDRLTIERNTQWTAYEHTQFDVDGDVLLTGVLRREGAFEGLVGTWQGTSYGNGPMDGEERLYRLTLDADGSGELHSEINYSIRDLPVAWSRSETTLVLDTGLGTIDYFIGPDALGSSRWLRDD